MKLEQCANTEGNSTFTVQIATILN